MLVAMSVLAVVTLFFVVFMFRPFISKGHSISRVAYINRSQREVWMLISDIGGQDSWRLDLETVERLEQKNWLELWSETDIGGQTLIWETIKSIPQQILDRRVVDITGKYVCRWVCEVAEFGDVTSLTITQEKEMNSFGMRFISTVLSDPYEAIDRYIHLVGRGFDAHVTITTD